MCLLYGTDRCNAFVAVCVCGVIDDIKNYYGEKIGLYFAFLTYVIAWIRKPAWVGLFVYICK